MHNPAHTGNNKSRYRTDPSRCVVYQKHTPEGETPRYDEKGSAARLYGCTCAGQASDAKLCADERARTERGSVPRPCREVESGYAVDRYVHLGYRECRRISLSIFPSVGHQRDVLCRPFDAFSFSRKKTAAVCACVPRKRFGVGNYAFTLLSAVHPVPTLLFFRECGLVGTRVLRNAVSQQLRRRRTSFARSATSFGAADIICRRQHHCQRHISHPVCCENQKSRRLPAFFGGVSEF